MRSPLLWIAAFATAGLALWWLADSRGRQDTTEQASSPIGAQALPSAGGATLPLFEVPTEGQARIEAEENPSGTASQSRRTPEEEEGSSAQAAEGVDLRFYVGDASHNLLPEARVVVSWGEDGSASAAPRPDGLILVRGVPEGLVQVRASCSGFATLRVERVVGTAPPDPEGLMLDPAGRLTGTVTRVGGELGPVSVYCWPTLREEDWIGLELDEEGRGAFSFEDAPLGQVFVVAVSPRWGVTDTVAATVRGEVATQVVLRFEEQTTVTGRVVDERKRPVLEARVALSVGPGIRTVAWAPVDADGRFSLTGAAPGSTSLTVTAEGFAAQTRELSGAGPEIDLGTITLSPAQPVTVCLVSEGTFRARGYSMDSEDGRVALDLFDADGCRTVEDAGTDFVSFRIFCPDKSYIYLDADLLPGRDWRFEVPVGGFGAVRLRFEGIEPAPPMQLTLVHPGPVAEAQIQRIRFLDELSPLEVEGILPGEVTAILRVGDEVVGTARAVVEGPDPVEMTLEPQESIEVRVVDTGGAPVVGAEVYCRSGNSGATLYQETDDRGFCSFPIADPLSPIGAIYAPSKGSRSAVSLAPPAEGPLTVWLDPSNRLEVTFTCDGAPVEGLSCVLADPQVDCFFDRGKGTDAKGRISFDRLHAGPYFLQAAEDTRFFPFQEDLDASGTSSYHRELRRRGDLVLVVVGPDESPRPGLGIELRPLEGQDGLGDWIRRGWIEVPPRGLVTGADGTLAIGGLATGGYAWRIGSTSGILEVRAGVTHERLVTE